MSSLSIQLCHHPSLLDNRARSWPRGRVIVDLLFRNQLTENCHWIFFIKLLKLSLRILECKHLMTLLTK